MGGRVVLFESSELVAPIRPENLDSKKQSQTGIQVMNKFNRPMKEMIVSSAPR